MPGDSLFLYSDGITEAFNEENALYGASRMDSCLRSLPPACSVTEIVQAVDRDVADFSGKGEQADDITILCLRYAKSHL
jgi:sigma-B regulation protein RsbU (phosphoserine phosphatase)